MRHPFGVSLAALTMYSDCIDPMTAVAHTLSAAYQSVGQSSVLSLLPPGTIASSLTSVPDAGLMHSRVPAGAPMQHRRGSDGRGPVAKYLGQGSIPYCERCTVASRWDFDVPHVAQYGKLVLCALAWMPHPCLSIATLSNCMSLEATTAVSVPASYFTLHFYDSLMHQIFASL
jgi:hypothetical protein